MTDDEYFDSPEGQAEIQKVIDDGKNARALLDGRGFKLGRGLTWIKPSPEHVVTREERAAIKVLKEKWDYSDLEKT